MAHEGFLDDEERDAVDCCAACGTRVVSGTDRSYGFGNENVLCAACATARGGCYDVARDQWDPPPTLHGLPDEAYGASPHERVGRRRRG